MKKAMFILMLIVAIFAANQSDAQVRPTVFRSPMIRVSAPVKPLAIISRAVTPPVLNGLKPLKLAKNKIVITEKTVNGIKTITTTITKNQSDAKVPKGDVISTDVETTPASSFLIYQVITIIVSG